MKPPLYIADNLEEMPKGSMFHQGFAKDSKYPIKKE